MFNPLTALSQLSNARSRSISAENVYGEPGKGGMAEPGLEPQPEVVRIGQEWGPSGGSAARELGRKWKVRPSIVLPASGTTTLMDVAGPGCIRHIWITTSSEYFREIIFRIYWDGEEHPSVEVPLGDFFCNATKHTAEVRSIPINVNPTNAMNSYFPMPFAKHARITLENLHPEQAIPHLYYTVNYELLDRLPPDAAYFHASFRRSNPQPYGEDFTIVDGIEGRGHFAGCYMTWQQNNDGWWGEGEVKMFLDGDGEFPTICGTGTEDYFGGAWCFTKTFTSPFLGYPFGGENRTGGRHSLYRFHIPDPVRFQENFKATIQALGWRSGGRYLPLCDDLSATSYWYQAEPHCPFPPLPDRNGLEII